MSPHVGDHRFAILAVEDVRVAVEPDRVARREQVVAVPDPAAEIEHAPRRKERFGEGVARGVPLPAHVEAAGTRHDALAGDRHGSNFRERTIPDRWSMRRDAAQSVFIP